MENSSGSNERPTWVRWMYRNDTKRKRAISLVGYCVLAAAICLALAGLESGRDTVLANIVFYWFVALAPFWMIFALWQWLAFRWLDRHNAWPSAI